MNPQAAAESLTFLARFFRDELFNVQYIWEAFAKVMVEANAEIRFRDDSWEQDWFLAKYASEPKGLGLAGHYVPPDRFHAFPTFDIESSVTELTAASGVAATRSRPHLDVAQIFTDPAAEPLTVYSALQEFYDLRGRIRAHRDPAMTQLNHTLAWLHLAFGHLFVGLALTPVDESNLQTILDLCNQRWTEIWNEKDVSEEHMNVPELIQWKLDVFYGAQLLRVGLDMHPSRQGQSEPWREDWGWLSTDVDAELALAGLRGAAQIMTSIPLFLFFQQKFREADTSVTTGHLLAAILFRRWVLQLHVMSWLEAALQRSWQHLRPQDLATFAFSALRPHWPRRLFGLSHRSMDIKAELSTLRAWTNFRYSIDATSIPHWETNVATVWGLFSTTPALIRVPSEHYEDSVWCRRERELFEYLRDRDDFLGGRFLIELPPARLASLDVVVPNPGNADTGLFKAGRFPRLTSVFMLVPFEAWENKLLACVAAVRFLFLKLGDAELTRFVCLKLAAGSEPPPEFGPLTNHPGGWKSIVKLFAEFQQEWAEGPDVFPIAVPPDALSAEDITKELARLDNRVSDLSDGLFDDTDVLAAYEWHRTVLPEIIGNNKYGSFFAIDYRQLTEEVWARDERLMVIRGLNKVRPSIPLWFLQGEGQRVDEWKGMGMNPVLTTYVPTQWDWMLKLLDEPGWPARFQKECKLHFSDKLAAACASTSTRGTSYYEGKLS